MRERSYNGSYTILTDWLRPQRESARVVAVRRFETPPGKQGQIDWGHLGDIELNGREHKLWGFTPRYFQSRLGLYLRGRRFRVEPWEGIVEPEWRGS